jgi:hypothetical protein
MKETTKLKDFYWYPLSRYSLPLVVAAARLVRKISLLIRQVRHRQTTVFK